MSPCKSYLKKMKSVEVSKFQKRYNLLKDLSIVLCIALYKNHSKKVWNILPILKRIQLYLINGWGMMWKGHNISGLGFGLSFELVRAVCLFFFSFWTSIVSFLVSYIGSLLKVGRIREEGRWAGLWLPTPSHLDNDSAGDLISLFLSPFFFFFFGPFLHLVKLTRPFSVLSIVHLTERTLDFSMFLWTSTKLLT